MRRKVLVGDQPWAFLNAYEKALPFIGFPENEIERLAGALMLTLYGIETGFFHINPTPIAADSARDGYMMYEIHEKFFILQYSCNGDEVIVDSILFKTQSLYGSLRLCA